MFYSFLSRHVSKFQHFSYCFNLESKDHITVCFLFFRKKENTSKLDWLVWKNFIIITELRFSLDLSIYQLPTFLTGRYLVGDSQISG